MTLAFIGVCVEWRRRALGSSSMYSDVLDLLRKNCVVRTHSDSCTFSRRGRVRSRSGVLGTSKCFFLNPHELEPIPLVLRRFNLLPHGLLSASVVRVAFR